MAVVFGFTLLFCVTVIQHPLSVTVIGVSHKVTLDLILVSAVCQVCCLGSRDNTVADNKI